MYISKIPIENEWTVNFVNGQCFRINARMDSACNVLKGAGKFI